MSDYARGAIDLMGVLGVDADDVVGDLMEKLKLVQEQANNKYALLKAKLDLIVVDHQTQLNIIDEVASNHTITVPCRSCGEHYEIDWELSKYDPETSYCGRSDRCCP